MHREGVPVATGVCCPVVELRQSLDRHLRAPVEVCRLTPTARSRLIG